MSKAEDFIKVAISEGVYPADVFFGGGYMPEEIDDDEDDENTKKKKEKKESSGLFGQSQARHFRNLYEKKWSGDVETSWHPKEGFFTQSAEKIADGIKSASKDLKQAMGRLNFYINRSGDNLSGDDKKRLELAKTKLHNLYGKD